MFAALSRRDLLHATLLLIGARAARAISEGGQVGVALLKRAGASDDAAEGIRRMLWEAEKRTSIDTAREVTRLAADDPRLFRHPLAVWHAERPSGASSGGAFSKSAFSGTARERLALFLRYGGLLWVDLDGNDNDAQAHVARELDALGLQFERRALKSDHVLHKSFYLLERVVGRTAAHATPMGSFLDGRLVVVETGSDVLKALARDKIGSWRHECEPGGEAQREQAMRFGVNLLMFATCTDYKADQVHIPFILKKTRR